MDNCSLCGRSLIPDEIALTKKLINRGTSRFFCLSCLSVHFDVSEDALQAKIREFREMGCTLFSESPEAVSASAVLPDALAENRPITEYTAD